MRKTGHLLIAQALVRITMLFIMTTIPLRIRNLTPTKLQGLIEILENFPGGKPKCTITS